MSKLIGTCKLCCREDENLLKKSHIIPNFMYQYLFDEQNRIAVVASTELTKKDRKFKTQPTGEYEQGILCSTCDNELKGQYESYAAKALYGKDISINNAPKVKRYQNKAGQKWSVIENIDYHKFKLFLLSIL